jgi:hypothetical protein
MDVGRFKEGHVLQGRFVDVAGHFVTAVTLPLDEYEGWI